MSSYHTYKALRHTDIEDIAKALASRKEKIFISSIIGVIIVLVGFETAYLIHFDDNHEVLRDDPFIALFKYLPS